MIAAAPGAVALTLRTGAEPRCGFRAASQWSLVRLVSQLFVALTHACAYKGNLKKILAGNERPFRSFSRRGA